MNYNYLQSKESKKIKQKNITRAVRIITVNDRAVPPIQAYLKATPKSSTMSQ